MGAGARIYCMYGRRSSGVMTDLASRAPTALPGGPEPVSGGRGLESDPALESELIRRVARGDQLALAVLYDRLAPLAYGLALRIAGDKRSAQDAVQEGFLKVWSGARGFAVARGTARAWVLRIVRNSAIDRVRSEGAHERAKLRAVQLDEVPRPPAPERPDLQLWARSVAHHSTRPWTSSRPSSVG